MKNIVFIILLLPGVISAQWYPQNVPTDINFLLSISFTDTNNGVSCGWYNFIGRAIYTTNGGNNWLNSQIPDSSRSLVTLQFINSQTGYIAGAYNINSPLIYYKSTLTTSHVNRSNSLIKKLYRQIGIDTTPIYKGLFLRTTNSGISWFTYGTLPDSVYYLLGLFFLDSSTGFITADRDINSGKAGILKTTSGGINWSVLNIPSGISSLWGVYFLDQNTGYSYGYRQPNDTTFLSVLLRTTNGGSNWDERNFSDFQNITSLDFTNASTGFITGSTIEPFGLPLSKSYKTTDGGLNWSLVNLQINDAVFSGVKFVKGSSMGIIFGDINTQPLFISKTTDYGNTWLTFLVLNLQSILHSSCLVDQNNWYISGGYFESNAVIFHTSNGGNPIGISNIGNKIPSGYNLFQNYPNPFNPVTKIRFEIRPPLNPLHRERDVPLTKEGIIVSMRIYDILGREVATLFNEQLKSGSYEVEWDASNYPSGLYFYKLTAGDFRQTKKMVLVK